MTSNEKPRSVWSTDQGWTKRSASRSIPHAVKYPAGCFTVGRDCADLTPLLHVPLAAIERRHCWSLAGVMLSVVGCLALAGLALQLAGVLPW